MHSPQNEDVKDVKEPKESASPFIAPAWKTATATFSLLGYLIALAIALEVICSYAEEAGLTVLAKYKPTTLILTASSWLETYMPALGSYLYLIANPKKFWKIIRFMVKPFVSAIQSIVVTSIDVPWTLLKSFFDGFYSAVESKLSGVITSVVAMGVTTFALALTEVIGMGCSVSVMRPSFYLVTVANQVYYVARTISSIYFTITLVLLRYQRVLAQILRRWFPWMSHILAQFVIAREAIGRSVCFICEAPFYGFFKAYEFVMAFFSKNDPRVLESKHKLSLASPDARARITFYTSVMILITCACTFVHYVPAYNPIQTLTALPLFVASMVAWFLLIYIMELKS